ncbi:MAG: hypothetical protein WDM91_12530 [Rhizomicrobium sp.]
MKAKLLLIAALSATLASCSGGVSTPEALRGTWSDACPNGMIQVDADTLHILYPEKQDFALTASAFDGRTWKASFENGGKKITDVYVFEDNTLRAESVIVDGSTFNSNKLRLTKCG